MLEVYSIFLSSWYYDIFVKLVSRYFCKTNTIRYFRDTVIRYFCDTDIRYFCKTNTIRYFCDTVIITNVL